MENNCEKIKILFIEDLQDDVIIAEETLRREGIVFESTTVTSLEDLKAALQNMKPDIVVSDYNLPGFTAIDALRLCRKYDPMIPFVVLTGSINEEVAVKCLKEGADDYVLKGHMKILPHTIKDALSKKRIEAERLSALRLLEMSEERYRYICQTISDYAYAFRVEEDGTMRGEWVSESFCKVFGFTIPEIDERGGWQSMVHPDDLPIAIEHTKRVISGSSDITVFRFITRWGESRWLKDYAVPVFDKETGRVTRIYGASQDITEQKQAEENLSELAKRFHHLLSSSPVVTYSLRITEQGFNLSWVSENIKAKTGYEVNEAFEPHWWSSNIHPDDRDEILKKSSLLFEQGEQSHEYRFRKKDGSYIWIHDKLRLIRDKEGRPLEVIGSWTDITDKKVVQEELEKERRLLLSIMETSPAGIVVTDETGKIIYSNRTFCQMVGHEIGINGLSCEELRCRFLNVSGEPIPVEDIPIEKVLTTKSPVNFMQFMIERPDGKKLVFSSNASPILDSKGNIKGVVCITLDITEQKKLEKQYLQAQKLEAVGRLAGGIAHDFNNLLSAIIGFSEMALNQLKKDEPVWEYIKNVYDSGEKAKVLIRQLMLFSRGQVQRLEILNLNNVISGLQKMLSRVIGEDIILKIETDKDLFPVKADRAQIEQVIMNLVVNARDAMPEGGTLIIGTENVELTESYSYDLVDLPPGRYVRLSVSDTGTGMTEEVKQHIFEPFFTTKEHGKGTGLGLATVYGIVKEHKGVIHVYSEIGKGTTFKIYLPATLEKAGEVREVKTDEIAGGTEAVVIVEDSEEVRRFSSLALQENSYKVTSFDSPLKALEYIKTTDEKIHLVLTDLVMPEMSGRELAEEIKKFRKDIRFLFMSGYTDDTCMVKDIKEGAADFLSKPFTVTQLLKKVKEVLSKARQKQV